jgi:hypothetical protein
MLKATKHNLKKLEGLFEELDYTVRYEKGTFQSGYAIVEDRKIAVINKFYDTEGRINCLLDILSVIEVESEKLSEKNLKLFKQLFKNQTTSAEAEEEE